VALGAADRSYEGGNNFPPVPAVAVYVVHYWGAKRGRAGAWRFCPSDFWGRPRELEMLLKARGEKV